MTRPRKWLYENPVEFVRMDVSDLEQFTRLLYAVVKWPGCLRFERERVYLEAPAFEYLIGFDKALLDLRLFPNWRIISSKEKKRILLEYNIGRKPALL